MPYLKICLISVLPFLLLPYSSLFSSLLLSSPPSVCVPQPPPPPPPPPAAAAPAPFHSKFLYNKTNRMEHPGPAR